MAVAGPPPPVRHLEVRADAVLTFPRISDTAPGPRILVPVESLPRPRLDGPERCQPRTADRSPVERLVRDLAGRAVGATVWHCLEVVAEGIAPGTGSAVRTARLVTNLVKTAESVGSGRGLDLKIPVAVSRETGFSLDFRATVGAAGGASREPVGVDVGLDPFDPGRLGWPTVEAAPATTRLDKTDDGASCGYVVVSRAEILEQTSVAWVDAYVLSRYVQPRTGGAPQVSVYYDRELRLGLLAVVPRDGDPYCPLLIEVDREHDLPKWIKLWAAVGAGTATELADVPVTPEVKESTVLAAQPVVATRIRRLPAISRSRARRVRRRAPRPPSSAPRAGRDTYWTRAFRALRTRYLLAVTVDADADDDVWHLAVVREHRNELGFIRADIVPEGGPGDQDACVDAIRRARLLGNLVDYAPGLVGYVVIGLAREIYRARATGVPPASVISTLLVAADLGEVDRRRCVVGSPAESSDAGRLGQIAYANSVNAAATRSKRGTSTASS